MTTDNATPEELAADAVKSIQVVLALGKRGAEKSNEIHGIIADAIRKALSDAAPQPTEQHRHFRSPEELADYLESIYETDSEGALAGGKWKYAQVAARAIRDTLAAERGEQPYGPVFVILRETKGSPDEVFEEIETVGGRSVRVPSAKKGFRRQIGPLYTRETITALRDSRRLLGRDLRQAEERNALLEKQLTTAQRDTLVNLAARLEQTLPKAPIARALGEAVVRYLRKEAGAIEAEALQREGGAA